MHPLFPPPTRDPPPLLGGPPGQYIVQIQVEEQTRATTRKALVDGYEWNETFKFKDVRNTDVMVLPREAAAAAASRC